jgi:hypothetical protein
MSGAEMIAAERERQTAEEGWTAEHDDQHDRGQLAAAACAYAYPGDLVTRDTRVVHKRLLWPWSDGYRPADDRYRPIERVRELAKAGALIAAEIDRLHRLQRLEDEVVMAGDGGRVPDVSEQRVEPGLAEEVAWAINCLRGIQGEINDLHRDGRLKAWDRSRLHDLIRCVVDGVQGRVGLERAAGRGQHDFGTIVICGTCGSRCMAENCDRYAPSPDPASVLAALLAESPEATVAAIEALLTTDETVEAVCRFGWGDWWPVDGSVFTASDERARSRQALVVACRSLLSKAPKGDGDA